jgi:2-polyprenyl-3-methyl-5-hydroxy-6-metoxy-1,4-benzoquinol methylase
MESRILISHDHSINQEYSDYIQPLNQDLFGIIDRQMKNIDNKWYNGDILDFGCNAGNLLRTSNRKICESSYTGVDVQHKPLILGRTDYPAASWLHYDGYHRAFNPAGSVEFPNLQKKFDYIFCIGVFMHCDMHTIMKYLDYFKSILNKDGRIIFSLWESKHWELYSKIFLQRKFNIVLPASAFKDFTNSIYLIDRSYTIADKESIDLEKCKWIETFFDTAYLMSNAPGVVELDRDSAIHSYFLL